MNRRVLLAGIGTALLLAVPAAAYVVNGHALLRRFAEAQTSIHAASSPLIGTARIFDSRDEWPVRLELTKGGGCRAQVGTPEGDAIVTRANGKVTTQRASLPALEAFVTLACPVLSMHDLPADDAETGLSQLATSMGIDLNVSSLSRVDDRVGYIVGAHPRHPDRPQLWFDKETDRPLRIIAQQNGQLWDIHLLDSASIATNRLAPRIATVWLGNERQLELRLMAANPKLTGHETPAAELEEDEE